MQQAEIAYGYYSDEVCPALALGRKKQEPESAGTKIQNK